VHTNLPSFDHGVDRALAFVSVFVTRRCEALFLAASYLLDSSSIYLKIEIGGDQGHYVCVIRFYEDYLP
jgi:hypothetical protein